MIRGLAAGSLGARIHALCPVTFAQLQAAEPGQTYEQLQSALRRLVNRGFVVWRGGVFVRGDATPTVGALLAEHEPPPEDGPDNAAESVSAFVGWSHDATQAPRVACNRFGPLPLGECIDRYTDAASGHATGRAACGRCSVGALRREALAATAS